MMRALFVVGSIFLLGCRTSSSERRTETSGSSGTTAAVYASNAPAASNVRSTPRPLIATGEQASDLVVNSIKAELRVHYDLLKPNWKVTVVPPRELTGCGADGTGCRWFVYIGDSDDTGVSVVWSHFAVDPVSGQIRVLHGNEEMDVQVWKERFLHHPY